MKEIEFKYYLYKNYDITYNNFGLFNYYMCLGAHTVEINVLYDDSTEKILPFIEVIDNKNHEIRHYQSFRKALNRIEMILNDKNQ